MTSGEHYREVFRAAPDGILIVDPDGLIVEANPEALRLFGYTEAELLGMPIEALTPHSVREVHRAHRENYAAHARPRPMGIGMELDGLRRDGGLVPVEISLSPLAADRGNHVVAIVRNLAERRRLRGFGAATLEAQEAERRRIARELHDETAQALATLLIRIKILERSLSEAALLAELAEIRDQLNSAMEGVRRMARGLRPPELEEIGLAAALRAYARERFPEKHIPLDFDGSEGGLSPDQKLAAYRIAQEAIFNAVRHGETGTVEVRARRTGDQGGVEVEIADAGRGFDPQRIAEGGAGLGIIGMDERAQGVGGRFELRSHPGEGTLVKVVFPIVPRASDG